MDAAVRDYVEGIPAERRSLFDRIHRLVLAVHPDVTVVLSYQIDDEFRDLFRAALDC
jgi:hypothetical protein